MRGAYFSTHIALSAAESIAFSAAFEADPKRFIF